MATMDEMVHADVELRRLEGEACASLGEYMQELVAGLPASSRLALTFARASSDFDHIGRSYARRSEEAWSAARVMRLTRDAEAGS